VRGQVAQVFRAPNRDRHGDPIDSEGNPVDMLDEDGNAFVGEIKGIIMGGLSASPKMSGEEATDTRGQIGCPTKSSIRIKVGDRIELNGVRYRVISNPEWDYPHYMTGTKPSHYWLDVEGYIG